MIKTTNPHFSQYSVSRDSLPTQSSNYAEEASSFEYEGHILDSFFCFGYLILDNLNYFKDLGSRCMQYWKLLCAIQKNDMKQNEQKSWELTVQCEIERMLLQQQTTITKILEIVLSGMSQNNRPAFLQAVMVFCYHNCSDLLWQKLF